ncbi:TPA: radical SAM protein [bacterium]|nr:radical SAM protein [bacterium]
MECKVCGKKFPLSQTLGVCLDCLYKGEDRTKDIVQRLHRETRLNFNLPPLPLRDKQGITCKLCVNNCKIGKDKVGYCGLRKNVDGHLINLGGTSEDGILEWYYDLLPTNCVADWVCLGKRMSGYKNMAVFYKSCTFNCLFCQNWHYRYKDSKSITSKDLASFVDEKTACICYFGGDPASQMMHAIATSKIALKQKNVMICWETNGSMNRKLLEEAAEISLYSNGCIKFDLKAFDESLHHALCGTSNKNTLKNFEYLATVARKRLSPPFLIASTLLVPYYITPDEVKKIALFIKGCSSDIPYALLAFHPQFYMKDLPTTSRKQAEECLKVSYEVGLKNVRIGNIYLLS